MPGVTMEPQNNMASLATKPQVEAGAPGFSYAQAAKGRAPSSNISASQSSQAPSGTNTPSKITTSTSDSVATSSNNASTVDEDRNISPANDSNAIKEATAPDTAKKSVSASSPSSPSIGTASTSTFPKEDEASLPPHLAEASWRTARPKTANDHHIEGAERRSKGKKGKKEKVVEKETEKEKEKEKEEVKPEVFVAAPPPTVNIWQQRKEAAAAKTPVVATSPAAISEQAINGASHEHSSKSAEAKKKNTAISSDDTTVSNTQPSKTPKKSIDVGVKKEEGRRVAPRGQRVGDKDDKAAATQVPPPVEDAVSWPTPEIAVEEDKRQAQEKVDKVDADESTAGKPRVKKPEWVTVPFVPSVTFNTQLPARGGRGRGGGRGGREGSGRGGHGASGSISGEKTFSSTPTDSSASQSRERPRESSSTNRATSLPPSASKKAAGDTSSTAREQRKPSAAFDKSKVESPVSGAKTEGTQSRRESVTTQVEVAHDSQPSQTPFIKAEKAEQGGNLNADLPTQTKGSLTERKGDTTSRSGEPFNGNGQVRERGENRGRGGRGGRGGYNNFVNGQPPYTNGHSQQPSNGYGIRQNSVPYSPPSQHNPQYANGGFAQNQRGRNGQSRAQSIPGGAPMYGRFPQNGPNGMQMSPIQGYDYQGPAVGPFVDYSVLPMVVMQLEYYFSIDNLCKDVYLRKHMDTQGFVFLNFIGRFKRIQSLTADNDVLRLACQESEIIEIVTGDDGADRVRRQDGWEQWVMPLEERDEGARNAGPQHFLRQYSFLQTQQMNQQRLMTQGHPLSPPPFSPNGSEVGFRPFALGPPVPVSNGVQFGEYGHQTESPLSAAVPDFNPGLPLIEKSGFPESDITYTDAEVDHLTLVYNSHGKSDTKIKAPYHSAASRTFSNGSIDSRTIAEELAEQQSSNGTPNGIASSDSSPESLRRSRSPLSTHGEQSPTKQLFGNAPPVMWVKGQRDPVPGSLRDGNNHELYNVLRSKALHVRHTAASTGEVNYDLKVLYGFWPHFLVRNFNPRMYDEFRTLAMEDAQQGLGTYGLENLIAFYDEILLSKRKTINDILARHYVDVVRTEAERSSTERPGLAKLRSAWRNGALDLKSRKKIQDLLDPKLREELER